MNNPEFHTCATCGHQWRHGQSGSHHCSLRLVEQRDKLLDAARRVFAEAVSDKEGAPSTVALADLKDAIRAASPDQPPAGAPDGFVPVPVYAMKEIVRSIRQHIDQGVASEALVASQRPGYGTGIYTYLKHRMDEFNDLLAAAQHQAAHPQSVVHEAARQLVDLSESLGQVITIERTPLYPLAMGHAEYLVAVREKRGPQ